MSVITAYFSGTVSFLIRVKYAVHEMHHRRILMLCNALILFLIAAHSPAAEAQNFDRLRTEVRQQQQETRETISFLQNQISRIEAQVSEASTEYNAVYRQFEQLQQELSLRTAIVQELREEQIQIEREVDLIDRASREAATDLERLQHNFKRFMRQVYMQGKQQEIVLLLTSGSLSQAQSRRYYLRRFAEYRESQARLIRETQAVLEQNRSEKQQALDRNELSLAEARNQQRRMEERRSEQQQLVNRLQQDRRALEQQLRQNLEEIENLNQTFNRLLAEEERIRLAEEERFRQLEAERQRRLAEARQIEDNSEREREIARLSEPTRRPAAAFSAAELELISEAFREARGQLPWPVREGVITRRFGNYIHPVYRTSTPNPGIHITTEPRSPVYAVHDGYVLEIMLIMGFDDTVFVNHGTYVTAYANLTEISVNRNAQIRAGDIIGLSGDEDSTNGPALVFLIGQGNNFVDPQHWLSRNPQPLP
ncbi:MAG: peptidoglycan DD-metalloendopeptidase family protein [Candidatus Cyclonatronum sp.]|uniref:murein hydrolase activator EnvC family protein n=1 Tax=Cyclonatronum sp. TaxID=3024185 RepID=UPI0025C3B60B|nr:peptidoglycan DD-metalloendopeptidase family protein [Cyclonatronum sp.]MCH8486218.1 peptidoglycan DD-metalloendopeptidase family protein [Cyclonatronum sp.]